MEEQRAQHRDLTQHRKIPRREARSADAHEVVAEEICKVAAGEGEDESDRHLRLLQRDGRERDDERDHGSNCRAGQKTGEQAARLNGNGEASHRGEEDRPVQRKIDDAGAFGDRLADDGKDDGGGGK